MRVRVVGHSVPTQIHAVHVNYRTSQQGYLSLTSVLHEFGEGKQCEADAYYQCKGDQKDLELAAVVLGKPVVVHHGTHKGHYPEEACRSKQQTVHVVAAVGLLVALYPLIAPGVAEVYDNYDLQQQVNNRRVPRELAEAVLFI